MGDSRVSGRRMPIGAEVVSDGIHFRLWAPTRREVSVVILGQDSGASVSRTVALTAEPGGYFSGTIEGIGAGTRYAYRLAGDATHYPDLASRFQPEGPHGPSEVIDPAAFEWRDDGWRGVPLAGQVIYEMHVGTFTREGTWEAAARELPELAQAGITVIELMPVSEFPGRFGWGYDGVDLFAPTRLYGRPDDLRRFVDRAHGCGLAVILDVVYNHVGPDGAFFRAYSPDYYTDRYENEWGDALNFDGPDSGSVREFFIANAGYWIDEFHMDGLRLDATQTIHDGSPEHILKAIARRAREAAGSRSILLIGENESQSASLARPSDRGGCGLDALWNDDFHHVALVAATGQHDAYFSDYRGTPQEFVSALKYGYLYQGQYYVWQKKRRGSPAWDLPPAAFVVYLENHDQVANSGRGERLHQLTSPGRFRALTAVTLLAPGPPMLFQGQEFGSTSPFLFFADHNAELAPKVRQGRGEFLGQFPRLATDAVQAQLADPGSPETFARCRLDFSQRQQHAAVYDLHKDLLRLRRETPAFRAQRWHALDGAVLSPHAWVLRYFTGGGGEEDRLVLVNLGADDSPAVLPEPLLAPPAGMRWRLGWSSDDLRYGGPGVSQVVTAEGIRLPAESAHVLVPGRD